ncbi:MAG: LytTR family DNA-binding domain-containing protein [Ginsengibacter sp.]
MKLRCIIVDDEPVARKGIGEDIKDIKFIELAGFAENGLQANDLIASQNIDLIFLDIHMPKLSGLDFLKTIKDPPLVIIITAYNEYAIEGFNLNVIDYLVKPVSFERLLKACNKAKEYFDLKNNSIVSKTNSADYFFIKCESKYEKIFFDDLLFVEAADNYVIIHTMGRTFITYLTLKNIEEYLAMDNFIKVHKSFIVAVNKIDFVEGNSISINKKIIPISRNMKEEVLERIVNKKLIRR